MRRTTRLSIRRKMSGTLASLLAAISVLSTFGAVPTMASDNSVKLSYQHEKVEKVGLHVTSENDSFSSGSDVVLNVYIQNNSGEVLEDGTLKWFDNKDTLSAGGFVFDSEYNVIENAGEAETAAAPAETAAAPAETAAAPAETAAAPAETAAAPAETAAAPAGPAGPASDVAETKAAAGPASDNSEIGDAWEEEWTEDDEVDNSIEGPYLDSEGNLCNIDLAPGEIFEVQFTGTIGSEVHGLKNRDIRFTFGARRENGKRLSNNYQFQFNTGLMALLPVDFWDGNQVETNEENTLSLRLGLDDIEYMFDEVKDSGYTAAVTAPEAAPAATPSEAVPATPSEAVPEISEEVIQPETESVATPSEAEQVTETETAVPEETVTEEIAEETPVEETVEEETVTEETVAEETEEIQTETTELQAEPEQAIETEAEVTETIAEETAVEETVTEETVAEETEENQLETTELQTEPEQTVETEAEVTETIAEETAVEETVTEETVAEETEENQLETTELQAEPEQAVETETEAAEETAAEEIVAEETEAIQSETEITAPPSEEAPAAETVKTTEVSDSSDDDDDDRFDDDENDGVFNAADVKYTIETYGVKLKGVKARFNTAESGPAESVADVTYRVASGTEPGIYFGKVTASIKFNGNTYKTTQGFAINVTGESQITLKGNFNGAEVVVSGPADSFPEGNILSLKITEITPEQRALLDEAIRKMEEATGTIVDTVVPMDIKVIADGVEQDLNGPVSVTFSDVNLENPEKKADDTAEELIDVWHLDEDMAELDKLDSRVKTNGDVVMTTDHFSVKLLTVARTASPVAVVESDEAAGVTVKVFNYNENANDEGLGTLGYKFFQGNYTDDEKEGSVDGAKNKTSGSLNKPTMEKLLDNGYPDTTSGSMEYLYDDTYLKGTMSNGGGLFQKDEDGYFYYDSQFNSAYYNESGNIFTLYDTAVRPKYVTTDKTDIRWGNFLPFNPVEGKVTVDATLPNGTPAAYLNDPVDLWFGMAVEFDFFMPKDGKLNGEPMIFDFHGDDDVYVYIDDVLVLDIGGTHAAESATIDFSTGTATDPNGNKSGRSLKDIFAAAGKTDVEMDGNTFADYTPHKLKFFYMERGGNISYCRLRFNMPILPDGSLTVTKELTAESSNVTEEMEAFIANNPDYQFKFRVVDADASGKATNDLFVPAGTQYEILENGVSTNPKSYGTVGSDGYFSLKPGQSAQFLNMLQLGDGSNEYVVEEVMPASLSAQYEGAVIQIGSGTGTEVKGTTVGEFTSLATSVLSAYETNAVTYRNKIKAEATVDIEVTKKWDDNSDVCGIRPDSVSFGLYVKNGDAEEAYIGKTTEITLKDNGTNTWTGSFEDLPMWDENGSKIEYIVRELDGDAPAADGDKVLGDKYLVKYSAMTGTEAAKEVTITNTHKHTVNVTKVWNDTFGSHGSVYYGIFKNLNGTLKSVDGKAHMLTAGTTSTVELEPTGSVQPYIIRELEEVETAAEGTFTDTETGKNFRIIESGGKFGDAYKVSYSPSSGIAEGCESNVTIINTYAMATIMIGKRINNYSGSLEDDKFIIKVKADGKVETGLVLSHNELSKGIEVYAGNGIVDITITEVVPKEYAFAGITQGTVAADGKSLTDINGDTMKVQVVPGETTVLWVHNDYSKDSYFHNDADALNKFNPAKKLEAPRIEKVALIPEREDGTDFSEEEKMM